MAINRGPKISTNGLVLSYDIKDAVSFPNQSVNTMYNLVNTGANHNFFIIRKNSNNYNIRLSSGE